MKTSRGESIKLPRYHSYSVKNRTHTRPTTCAAVTGGSRSVLLEDPVRKDLSAKSSEVIYYRKGTPPRTIRRLSEISADRFAPHQSI